MKSVIQIKALKMLCKGYVLLLLSTVFVLPSCYNNDDIGGNFYTFKGDLIGKYLTDRSDKFSEFNRMLDTTKVMGLLNAYGQYTCFAPTNDAMLAFYKEKGRSSIQEFPFDTILIIVYNHIIKNVAIPSYDLKNGRITYPSMNDRFISFKRTTDPFGMQIQYLNETSPILVEDSVQNGIVYTIGQVFHPTDFRLDETIFKDKKFSLFYNALDVTRLREQLVGIKDNSYVPLAGYVPRDEGQGFAGVYELRPLVRKYGYTALMESDSTFKANGISTLDDMKAYARQVYDQVYPNDAGITDVTDRKNSLNRFIAYHLINKQLGYRKFIYDLDISGIQNPTKSHQIRQYDMFEYIETMCPNTLMEVRTNRATNEGYGIFNMIVASNKGVRINPLYKDKDALNGVYHEIDNILAYTPEFVSQLTSKRLRMDVTAFFPELVNNNMRASKIRQHWILPDGYLDRMTTRNTQGVWYLNGDDRFMDYQGDEMFFVNLKYSNEVYDVTVTTLPLPAGTYEVRLGYLSNGGRGVAQFYWDGQPCGIPLDMNPKSTVPQIGYVLPGSEATDPYGYENDKMMRNRGYMKGPSSIQRIEASWYPEGPGRNCEQLIRRILGTYTFFEDGTHTIRAKSVDAGQFEFDWLEFIPTEAIETEGVD